GGLRRIPHVGGPDADHLGSHDLTGTWLLALAESLPRLRLDGIRRGEASGHRRENLIPPLSLLHLPAERLPPPLPGHARRHWHRASLVCRLVLRPAQQPSRECSRSDPRG